MIKKGILLLIFCLLLGNPLSAKVFDCFLFFNEFELFKVRLEELYNVVDYFVLVESEETFRGEPKPFYFKKNKKICPLILIKLSMSWLKATLS